MDKTPEAHPSQDSWTQLLRNQARGGDSRRRSWWTGGGRKDAPTSSGPKKELTHPDVVDNIIHSHEAMSPEGNPYQIVVPVQPSSRTQANSIRLNEEPAPEPHMSRRTTKSDGGSVGSNLKKLSIDDRRGWHQKNSPLAIARPKRDAEPSGKIHDGGTRQSKREPLQATLKGHIDRDMGTNIAAHDSANMAVSSKPGIIQLPPQLQSRSLHQFNSDVALLDTGDSNREPSTKICLQSETRPLTQDQLVNEVKGIYAGLVMVEKKCIEIDRQQSKTTNKLSDEQWQALIALHRTLLYEHHDFFLASQHPSSSPALRRLATKYAMPARMWRHGIHSFLELLRHRLPDSLDHMLGFVYLAYSMMALLMESVPSFVETWIECLGDLARYRMAIEEIDLRDRETWSVCAKMWYEKAADKCPNVDRIQHHLAVLARPNIVQQLFYYSTGLVSVAPFQNARESVMLLFNPFLQQGETISQKYIAVEAAFVTFRGVLFAHESWKLYPSLVDSFLSGLDTHIVRTGSKFRTQGPGIVSSLCAAAFDFGNTDAFLVTCFQLENERRAAQEATSQEPDTPATASTEAPMKINSTRQYWKALNRDAASHSNSEQHPSRTPVMDSELPGSDEAAAQAVQVLEQTIKIVTQRIGDKNIDLYMHFQLAFVWSLAHVPRALGHVKGLIPWEGIITLLNTLERSGAIESGAPGDVFPLQLSGTGRQLPEDFPQRGLIRAQHYFPEGFFQSQVVDEDERTFDLPSHAACRAERYLWLGSPLYQRHSRRGRGQRKNKSYWHTKKREKDFNPFERECLFRASDGILNVPAKARMDSCSDVSFCVSLRYLKSIGREHEISTDFEDPNTPSIGGRKTGVQGILRNMSFRMKGTSVTFCKDFYVSDMLDDVVDVIFGWRFMVSESKLLFDKACSVFTETTSMISDAMSTLAAKATDFATEVGRRASSLITRSPSPPTPSPPYSLYDVFAPRDFVDMPKMF